MSSEQCKNPYHLLTLTSISISLPAYIELGVTCQACERTGFIRLEDVEVMSAPDEKIEWSTCDHAS
jgi:hypothetical protein